MAFCAIGGDSKNQKGERFGPDTRERGRSGDPRNRHEEERV